MRNSDYKDKFAENFRGMFENRIERAQEAFAIAQRPLCFISMMDFAELEATRHLKQNKIESSEFADLLILAFKAQAAELGLLKLGLGLL